MIHHDKKIVLDDDRMAHFLPEAPVALLRSIIKMLDERWRHSVVVYETIMTTVTDSDARAGLLEEIERIKAEGPMLRKHPDPLYAEYVDIREELRLREANEAR